MCENGRNTDMKLHSLKNTTGARKTRKRKGRGMGSGLGKTSGRGHKGQKARKGYSRKQAFEGGQMPLIRRLPKRGYKNPNRKVYIPVNVGCLNELADGTEVTEALLRQLGLARGRADGIKLLGEGDLTRRVVVKDVKVSAAARAKIEAAGGCCESGGE